MPDSAGAVVFTCPNCGSAVAMEGDRGLCAYCNTPIERPGKAPPRGTTGFSPASSAIPRAALARPQSGRRGVPLVAALLLVILAALGGFLFGRAQSSAGVTAVPAQTSASGAPGQPSPAPALVSFSNSSVSDLVAVLPRDGPGGDLLAYMYHSGSGDSSFYTIARIDGATHAPRWESESLGKKGYQGRTALGGDTLYVTVQEQMLALRLSDGTTAWKASLDVEPQSSCEECLKVAGERVLVLEKNGGLQAFDAKSGQLAWSTRLDGTPRRMPLAGDRVLTVTDRNDKNSPPLNFLNVANGKSALQLDARCPKAADAFDDERPDADSPFLFSQDGKTMFAIYGFFAKCAQSWDLAAGKPRWTTALDERMAPPNSHDGILQTVDAVYIGNQGLLWALNTADGATRTLADDKEYYLTPLAARDGMLIVMASPTWDSQRAFLWGLDARSGERHWEFKLAAHDWIGRSSSGDWDLQLTPKGLIVLQVLRDDAKLVAETLNPRTGASLGRQENILADAHMPSLRHALWGDDTAWLQIDGDVFAVDLSTGKLAYRLS